MKLSEDFRDLLTELGKADVDYLLIGGGALRSDPGYDRGGEEGGLGSLLPRLSLWQASYLMRG
ncbi:MAG: hypothetical protein SF187_00495 [Deltaproteobacteria bacterium]|nr:hypothetical protein [Deltaproteobacteria bacterium]